MSQETAVDANTARFDDIRDAIQHAAHLLPAQGPITSFVHHNTLHAFEDMAFEDAVVEGAETFGCHPYLPEERYREKLARGRIRDKDIEAVLISELGDRAVELLGFLGTRFHLWMAMLAHPLLTGPTAELRWVVAETDALRTFREETPRSTRDRVIADTRFWIERDLRNTSSQRKPDAALEAILASIFDRFDRSRLDQWNDANWEAFTLHLLWLVCRNGVQRAEVASVKRRRSPRHRDLLLEATGHDSDSWVHDILIPFSAAYIDQGFADWTLPNREAGFYESFLTIHGLPQFNIDPAARSLRREAQRLSEDRIGPLESIAESLELLGVAVEERHEFVAATLLALRGYAGMIWQLETRGDRAAHSIHADSLMEFLAVRLILDRIELTRISARGMQYRGPLSGLREAANKRIPDHATVSVEQHAFLVFQLAQLIGWKPELLHGLSSAQWTQLLCEMDAFSGLQRRRIYHLAFERHYRIQSLDAVAAHRGCTNLSSTSVKADASFRPAFQIICCIDEREESFRRHLEEVAPGCETFGAAGFFAVAMYYRGAADAHYTPLCPVIIKPQHYVTEDAAYTFEHAARQRRRRRRAIGTVTRRVHVGSRTFAGGWLAAVFGSLASIPLVMRILFPRATARLRQLFGGFVRTPAVTQLQLEREHDKPGSEPGHIGYTVSEMAQIVERLVCDIGLTKNVSRIVIVCGHGSSSMNNPHEAAHDCGACAGGRGGPNARAFAQMANDPRVREIIAQRGLQIPSDTFFVGGYHNTCDDGMTYYDLDRLPAAHKADFEAASNAIGVAVERSAHERCRRFQSADLQLSSEAALRHVEGRAEDLSQVRPEYGHATNALCFVGRRAWSRGLFLDRRAFLQSYDPEQDDEQQAILTRILQAVIPVCAGINLEYYFSYVDPTGYGCGTKLPHNITSLLGVMNGAASDLRPGLPWQMVEIHEPVRLLFVIETTPQAMLRILAQNEDIDRLVRGNWVQLATLDPATSQLHSFQNGEFIRYRQSTDKLPQVAASIDWYSGWRDHLGFASIQEFPVPEHAPERGSCQ